MRSVSRVLGVHKSTIAQLLVNAGAACRAYHDAQVRNLTPAVIEVDELWSYIYAHQSRLAAARAAPHDAGDIWTWTALDATTKLLIAWRSGSRELADAIPFFIDVRSRLVPGHRTQLSTDGYKVYPQAIETVFGTEVDFGQLLKLYRSVRQPDGGWEQVVYTSRGRPMVGRPEPESVSTSYVERQNLNFRMGIKRFTRKTNAFSKLTARHRDAVTLFCTYHNFCRVHLTLGTTPAVASGLAKAPRPVEWLVQLIEARTPPPTPRGPDKQPRRRWKRCPGVAAAGEAAL